MTPPLDEGRRKLLLKVFRMPPIQGMKQRKSSITNAFVSSIIPLVNPSAEEIEEALTILRMRAETINCTYCGDKMSQWDHLRPLVVRLRPTGFISEIANLVPSCNTCNSSKGNSHWRKWMLGSAKNSPSTRQVVDLEARIGRLEAYEAWRIPTHIDFEKVLGAEAWDHYWKLWEAIK